MDPRSPQSRSRSRSRSGSRSRRSDMRHHRSPRSPPMGPGCDSGRGGGGGGGGRLSGSVGPARYDDYDPYSRAPTAYRERESRYPDYSRMADPYGGRPSIHGSGPIMGSGSGSRRSRSRSPMSSRRRHEGDRENPPAGRCIGIFGLSIYTKETDLHEVFSRYGPLDDVQIVYDAQSGRSRGFAFVYFQNVADAAEAKDRCNSMDIDGRKIRVDFSLTQRAHTPTPGVYMGKAHPRSTGAAGPVAGASGPGNGGGGYGRNSYNNAYPSHRSHHMISHNPYPPRGRYPHPHYPSAIAPVDYGRRRVTRSRSASPRKFYY